MANSDPLLLKALGGGIACMCAALVTNPIDVVKVRLQIQGEGLKRSTLPTNAIKYKGFIRGGFAIFQEEGLRGLYRGITASLLREASYSSIRIAGYDLVKELFGHDPMNPGNTPFWKKAAAGLLSGAAGAALANPTDLVKVRMQAHQTAGTSRYRNTFAAFVEIFRQEGVAGLYRGVGPTTQRAALLTAAQLASYDHIKQLLLRNTGLNEGILLHGICSVCSGFISAAVTTPVDVVKTRVMNQPTGLNRVYRNALDCFIKTARNEGLYGLYKGFIPGWARIGPHTIVTMLCFEQFRRLMGMRPV